VSISLKCPFPYDIHKRFPELLADRDLFSPYEDMIIPDAVHPGDVNDIRVVHPGDGRGQLLFNIFQSFVYQYLIIDADQACVFFFPFEVQDILQQHFVQDSSGLDKEIFIENRDGVKYFAITQHWYGGDSTAYRKLYSLCAVADFAPVYHNETVRGKTSSYDWTGRDIKGTDTVKDNAKRGFYLSFGEPNLNWNLDLETFEMLPLGEGKSFWINFYDAGLEPPKYVLYKVTGSEELALMNGEKVDCWKLYTEGSSPRGPYSETYWISKQGHEFLKEEDSFSGIYRYKIKMPGTAPDLLEKFTPTY